MKYLIPTLITLSVSVFAQAQTTFSASNDARATIRVLALDEAATVVLVSQPAHSGNALAVSERTVLRDARTGIAYTVQDARPGAEAGTVELTFAGFRDGATAFDLLDPRRQHCYLYFTEVNPGLAGR